MRDNYKHRELFEAIHKIMTDIDTRPKTRKLFYALLEYSITLQGEEE